MKRQCSMRREDLRRERPEVSPWPARSGVWAEIVTAVFQALAYEQADMGLLGRHHPGQPVDR